MYQQLDCVQLKVGVQAYNSQKIHELSSDSLTAKM